MNRTDSLPFNLALAYLTTSALWILGSDGLVGMLRLGSVANHVAQTSKGWFFVAVTSVLLYRILRWWQSERQRAELAQAESEARLRQMADSVDEVFWLTDPAKQAIWFVSSAYERVWGRSCQSLYEHPRSWMDSILEEDRAQVLEALPQQLQGTYDVTYRIRNGQGEERWIHDRAFPIQDEQGKVVRVAGVAADITRERSIAQALRASEESYRCLVELSPEGVAFQLDGTLSFVNPAMAKLFGARTKEELVGRQMLELVHSEDRTQARQAMGQVMSGEVVSTPRPRKFLRLDGSDFQGEILAAPFARDGQRGSLVLIRDVGERNRIASSLEQHRSLLQAIIQRSSDCIVAVDQAQRVLWFNPAAEKCLGCLSDQAQGKAWSDFFEAAGPVGIRTGGERFPVEVSEQTVELADGPVQTVVFKDLSERLRGEQKRKELEQQLRQSQKMEALGLLAGGVAHDFNNLLTVVLGAASIIEPASADDTANLEEIRHAAQRAADLTRQLLTFSRKQVVQLQELDLSQVFEGITGMLKRVLGAQVTLKTDFAPRLSSVRADAGMLEQVLLNLVVNSRDAMGNVGEIHIRTSEVVRNERVEGEVLSVLPGRYVCLEVEDNGSGIDPKDLPHIFDPFFTTKEVGKGTGLGLATIYGIMEQHEGGLQVLSQLGRGTRIRALFPALTSAKAGRPRTADLYLARGSGKVLVAEDDLALQNLIRRVLARCGYEVVTANNGLEALEIWESQSQSIDYLVTDLVMPGGVTGLDLGRRLRAAKSGLKVIYSSGYSPDLLDARSGLSNGDHFLAKPFTPAQLAQALHDIQNESAGSGRSGEDVLELRSPSNYS
ncbi:PAS domain S-box protein [bacterium]|nr:PAS domain S-box protein [bacterium]